MQEILDVSHFKVQGAWDIILLLSLVIRLNTDAKFMASI